MRITSIGEILMDMTQAHIDEKGVVHFAANPGGAPANVAVGLSRLGASNVAFVGCVGADPFGSELIETLRKDNVDTRYVSITDEASTTLAVVTVDKNAERNFSFCRKPGADSFFNRDLVIQAVSNTDMLHFGSFSLSVENGRARLEEALELAKKKGVIVSYDPNYRPTIWPDRQTAISTIRNFLHYSTILKISDDEIGIVSDKTELRDVANDLVERFGIRIVLITLGSKGAFWFYDGRSGLVPAGCAKVIDTNGAGDTFLAGFLSRIASNGGLRDLDEAKMNGFVAFANKAAGLTASRHGAIPAMPYLREMDWIDGR